MNNVKFTIITAVYNGGRTIEQTISSVLNQKYNNYEYIIIDGNSTDNTIEILDKYSDKIRWISEPDSGLYDALNKGINLATGDFINIIGCDDCLHDYEVLENIAKHVELNPSVDIICGGWVSVDETSEKYLECYNGDNHRSINENDGIFWTPHPGMFVRTSIMKKHLFDLKYKIASDYHFILVAYYKNKYLFDYIDLPIVFFSRGGMSNTNIELAQRENALIFEELGITDRVIQPSNFKKFVKKGLQMCGGIDLIHYFKNKINMRIHHCDNKICRWCGRGIK